MTKKKRKTKAEIRDEAYQGYMDDAEEGLRPWLLETFTAPERVAELMEDLRSTGGLEELDDNVIEKMAREILEQRVDSEIRFMATRHAQKEADEKRPTPRQRATRKKKQDEEARWRERAASGAPPELPQMPWQIREAGGVAKVAPGRIVKNSDGTYTAQINIDGKLRKLCKAPSEQVAARVAQVARVAARVVYKHTAGDPPMPKEYAATACVSQSYPLGYKRSKGRKASGASAAGQSEKIDPILSGWVVEKVGELLGCDPVIIPSGNLDWHVPRAWADAEGLREHNADIKKAAAKEAQRWHGEITERYRAADLLTDEAEVMLTERAKEYERGMLGFSVDDYEQYLQERERTAEIDENVRKKEWFDSRWP